MGDSPESPTEDLVMDVGRTTVPVVEHGRGAAWQADTGPRRAWASGVAILVVVVAATAVVARWREPDVPDVTVTRDTVVVTPPALPDHPIARRWQATVAPGERLAALGVHDDLVVALAVPDQAGHPAGPRVMAWDTASGRIRWERGLDGTPAEFGADLLTTVPTVHLVGPSTVTTLAPPPGVDATTAVSRQFALDPADGTSMWRDQRAGTLQVLPERGVATVTRRTGGAAEATPTGQPRTDVMDLRTGTVVFTARGWPLPLGADDWAFVPDGDDPSWQLVDRAGNHLARVHTDAGVVSLGDTIVTVRDADVVGRSRSGRQRWTSDLPGAEPIAATEVRPFLLALALDRAMVGAWRVSDKEVGRLDVLTLATVTADGAVTSLDAPRVTDIVASNGFNLAVVDGEPLVLCADRVFAPPTGSRDREPAGCPGNLAAVALDGQVLASSDTGVTSVSLSSWDGLPGMPGIATTTGLLVIEDDDLVLRAWRDFTPTWRLEVSAGFLPEDSVRLVAPSPRGLALGHGNGDPGQPDLVTWAS